MHVSSSFGQELVLGVGLACPSCDWAQEKAAAQHVCLPITRQKHMSCGLHLKASRLKASQPHFDHPRFQVLRIFGCHGAGFPETHVFVGFEDANRVFRVFAWRGPDHEILRIRPTSLMLTGFRCEPAVCSSTSLSSSVKDGRKNDRTHM